VARNQSRNLNNLLLLAGVTETAKGPKVSDDIQLTYQLSDLSDLVARVPAITAFWSETSPSNAARRGVLELTAPSESGIDILSLENTGSTSLFMVILPNTRITNDTAFNAVDYTNTGEPIRTQLQEGTGTVASLAFTLGVGDFLSQGMLPLYIPPGRILHFMTSGLNFQAAIAIVFREVPLFANRE